MTVVQGTFVMPGTVLATMPEKDSDGACAGEGVYCRRAVLGVKRLRDEDELPDVSSQLVASRAGAVQWDGGLVSVFSKNSMDCSESVVRSACTGPRAGDVVHVRCHKVTHTHVFGEIIAIGGKWSAAPTLLGSGGGFRGVLRVEDIRPFKVTNKQALPPSPMLACRPGDVLLAAVLSQSDAKQYQLSTVAENCGVVEAITAGGQRLVHQRGRRDVMLNPASGQDEFRWTPLTQ